MTLILKVIRVEATILPGFVSVTAETLDESLTYDTRVENAPAVGSRVEVKVTPC